MVNGRVVVESGRVLTLDAASIEAKARDYARQIRRSLR
jgi:hypothetical protein